MSKRTNNNTRFVTSNKPTEQNQIKHRKCAHHIYSHNYAANMKQHYEIMEQMKDKLCIVDMDSTINIKIILHFLAPRGSYNKDKVLARAYDVILSLNDDFNNYSNNPNTMNNFRYKSIINQVFTSNMAKQNIYLGQDYLEYLPSNPSNITFELGEIYYYPVKSRLNLSQYDDVKEVEIEYQVIKQFIHQNKACAINPDCFLNIWVIDMTDTCILGFSNFPWEMMDKFHGVVINRRGFFPEEYGESNFATFKTFTHEVGHYLGLLHVLSHNSGLGVQAAVNINADCEKTIDNAENLDVDLPDRLCCTYDPCDKNSNKLLHTDIKYNPLFMNFMDYTHDKYVAIFTQNQLQKMRFMILTYRPNINSIVNRAVLPIPRYNPDTDTSISDILRNNNNRNPPLIPSHEIIHNPRLSAQGFMIQQPQIPIDPIAQQQAMGYETRINTNISDLIPNLSSNNMISKNGSVHDQLINNIQKNLPIDPNDNTLKQAQLYDSMKKQHQAYTSSNSYATNYPHDPYTTQQYQNQMALYQQMQNDPACNKQIEEQKIAQCAQPDPRLMQYQDPRFMMPIGDPNLASALRGPPVNSCGNAIPQLPIDPSLGYPMPYPAGPQTGAWPYPMPFDPRMMQQNPLDPRMMQQNTIDPRMMQQNPPKNTTNKIKRFDPQLRIDETKKKQNKCVPEQIEEESDPCTEINQDALKNLRNHRAYPKYASAKTETKKNSLDPNCKKQPLNLREIAKQKIQNRNPEFISNNPLPIMEYQPTHMPSMPSIPQMSKESGICNTCPEAPSILADRVSRIDEQLKNIKANIPILNETNTTNPAINAARMVTKASQNDNKQKFNKYGQLANPANTNVGRIDTRGPSKKFVRTRPAMMN